MIAGAAAIGGRMPMCSNRAASRLGRLRKSGEPGVEGEPGEECVGGRQVGEGGGRGGASVDSTGELEEPGVAGLGVEVAPGDRGSDGVFRPAVESDCVVDAEAVQGL